MNRSVLMIVVLVAVAASACSDDAGDETTTTAAQATTTTADAATTTTTEAVEEAASVNIANFTFHPGDVTVAVGTTLTWTNGDGPSHTTTSDEEGWDSGVLPSGDTFELVFDEPGVFAYHCSIHPSMTATVTVEG